MDNRPIGVFDSGLGGLTVVSEIKSILPRESVVYLGDTARVPYGTRSKEVVVEFAKQDAEFLVKKNIKYLVIACNTASAQAGLEVKNSVNVPVLDVVTSCVESVNEGKNIGVIATRGTVNSHAYKKNIKKLKPNAKVHEVACPLFVPFIEEGEIDGKLIDALVEKYLKGLKEKHLDTLILGCTHYPMIEKKISKFMGSAVEIIDSGREVAKKLKIELEKRNMLTNATKAEYKYFVTDLNDNFVNVASWFLNENLKGKVQKMVL